MVTTGQISETGDQPSNTTAAAESRSRTYTIPRYPVHLIDIVSLADGQRVTVRPMLPQDAELQQTFVRGLSAASRYNRFMSAMHELPPSWLERLMRVDYRSHMALIAEVFSGGAHVPVGEARYVIDAAGNAEFAIAIADAWQGMGLGSLLLQRLECSAASSGARRMAADALAANGRMLSLAGRAGYRIAIDPTATWLVRLEKDIDARLHAMPPDAVRGGMDSWRDNPGRIGHYEHC